MKYIEMKPYFDYLDTQVKNKSIYCLGGQGEIVGKMTVDFICSNESSLANAARVLKHIANVITDKEFKRNIAMIFDCSGLGSYWFQKEKVYTYDHTANAMYKETVPIPVDKRQPGDFVFGHFSNGKAGHVGYLEDGDMVVEAKGRDDGVVKRKFEEGAWTKVGRPDFWAYKMKRDLKNGNTGKDVGQLQARLTAFGCPCGTIDNIFGKKTEAAVKKFQEVHFKKAPNPGVMDKETAIKLGFTYG
jgi:hypothetical protein